MPSRSATRRASTMPSRLRQIFPCGGDSEWTNAFIVTPTTWCPCSMSSAAATDESTRRPTSGPACAACRSSRRSKRGLAVAALRAHPRSGRVIQTPNAPSPQLHQNGPHRLPDAPISTVVASGSERPTSPPRLNRAKPLAAGSSPGAAHTYVQVGNPSTIGRASGPANGSGRLR